MKTKTVVVDGIGVTVTRYDHGDLSFVCELGEFYLQERCCKDIWDAMLDEGVEEFYTQNGHVLYDLYTWDHAQEFAEILMSNECFV